MKRISDECLRRAGRTFLQTACGMLAAELTAAAGDFVKPEPEWKTGLLTLLAAAIAAGIAAVMNLHCE